MKKYTFLISIILIVAFGVSKAQDTLYMYKSGQVVGKRAINDIDSIIFYIPQVSCVNPFIDPRDGNSYQTILIGNQCWMKENLKYLPSVVGASTGSTSTPYFYVYEYNGINVTEAKSSSYYSTYGVLYNWPASMIACPSGWHLPSDNEWKTLEMSVGMSQQQADLTSYRGTNEGSKLAGNSNLWTNGALVNNAQFGNSDFDLLPQGSRNYTGYFGLVTIDGYWWNATEEGNEAWYRYLDRNQTKAGRFYADKGNGLSVRCVKD